MLLALLLLIPFHIMASFAVATWVSHNKKMSFGWAFFFGLTLTAITAILQAGLSKKRNEPDVTSFFDFCLYLSLTFVSAFAATCCIWRGVSTISFNGCIWLINAAGLWGACLYYVRLAIFGERTDDL